MAEKTSEKDIAREVEELLRTAEDYLWRAKVNKSKDSQNFEVMLALEYATKTRDKSKQLIHIKEFYDNTNRRADFFCLMSSPSYGSRLLAEIAMKK